ncbi:sarcosine oxidase subunit gamma [Roseovarius sp. EL26]|uniref:sarcosine oxidase subunit gamma n=1 Tax=Roseovarius sp. EL26 TaxID=2126672 RepID=UPI000EA02859|nr:sarcosine oxidase subunit gamma [Roseovarius sp. EL26]
MVELIEKTPFDSVLPFEAGTVSVSEVEGGVLTSVAPYKGQSKALSDTLKAAHGMAAPAPNRATGKEGSRAIWFGREMVLLCGPAPDAKLAKHAALTDQSDAWAVAMLEGEHAAEVLARLTPIDLRPEVFKRGHTARSELQHMMASITRIGDRSYQILVFRAFAQTLAHDLKNAMQGVAARHPR